MAALRWRGKEDDDHHSRNLSRNIDVGRMRFSDHPRNGSSFVRRTVMGERVEEPVAGPIFVVDEGVYGQFDCSFRYRVMRPHSLQLYTH